jgi:P27 family predicted phage terminase small subunit
VKGRKPKPLQQKVREGNPGKRKLPEPLELDSGPLSKPADLPAEASALWDDLVPLLEHAGVAERVDRAAFSALCVQWARAERARAVLAAEGLFALGSTGQLVEHPGLGIERNACALFLRFAEQYGLTPAARARISAARMGLSMADEIALEDGGGPELRLVGE